MFPPKKKLSTPPKTNTLYPKIPPPKRKRQKINIQPPNSHFLVGFKKSKTVHPFRGIRTPHRFLPKHVFRKTKTQGARRDRWKTSVSNSNPSPPGWWPSRPSPEPTAGWRSTSWCRNEARWVSFGLGYHFYGSGNRKKKRQRLFGRWLGGGFILVVGM